MVLYTRPKTVQFPGKDQNDLVIKGNSVRNVTKPSAFYNYTSGYRRQWHPTIQQNRNDLSHDLYLLNRRHRQILRSMHDLTDKLEEADSQLKHGTRNVVFNDSSSLPARMSRKRTFSLERQKTESLILPVSKVSNGGRRKGTISLLPPLSKDGSFMVSKHF